MYFKEKIKTLKLFEQLKFILHFPKCPYLSSSGTPSNLIQLAYLMAILGSKVYQITMDDPVGRMQTYILKKILGCLCI